MADDVKCLKELKTMCEGVNWEIEEERRKFLLQLDPLIAHWKGQLPNLRDIFRREEIEWLLTESIDCKKGLASFVRFVIKSGYKDEPDVDENDKPLLMRTTPIHLVARRILPFWLIMQDLFEIYDRFDLNYTDESGLTHFHVACEYRLGDIMERFLDLGQDPNCLSQISFEPPIHLALNEDEEMVVLLLKHGADPNAPNQDGLTLLQLISQTDSDYLVHMLFELCEKKYQIQLDTRDKLGNTPLHSALNNGNKFMAELLLIKGANPNLANEDGSTPLHLICNRGEEDNYDVNPYIDNDDLVVLFFKINEEKHQVVQIDAQDKLGNTALHLALLRDDMEMAELLLRKGADPNLANNEGLTALHIICKRDELESDNFVQVFFQINAEKHQTVQVDAQDKLGNTPLHYAVADGRKLLTIKLLLRNGVDLNLANEDGSTPLHLICNRDHYRWDDLARKFFEFIHDRWVHFGTRDKLGRTPMQLAAANLLPHAMQVLFEHGTHLYNHAMSDFSFPTESYFGERYNSQNKLKIASSALAVVEQLEKRRYQLNRSDALTIIKFFATRGLFETSSDPGKFCYDDEKFANQAKNIKIADCYPYSLYDLIRLRPEQAAKRINYSGYLALALMYSHIEIIRTCTMHLCEKMARGFFRRWSLDPFLELTHYRLPILCCDMIMDQLMNEDLCNICLAAAGQSS